MGWEYHPRALLKTVFLCRALCWQIQAAHLICSEMQEQLGGKSFLPGCCHPMVFFLLFSI